MSRANQFIAGIAALGFSIGSAFAQESAQTPQKQGVYKSLTNAAGETVNLRSCFDSEGVQVRLRMPTQRDRQMAQDDGRSAVSGYAMGPIITMPAQTVEAQSAPMLKFIWEHECSHHSLGHVRDAISKVNTSRYYIGYFMSSEELHQVELEADCEAIQGLVGRGEMSIADIYDVLSQFPTNEHSTTHPHTDERIAQVEACAVQSF